MKSNRVWERIRFILVIIFAMIIVFNIFTIYRNYSNAEEELNRSDSEKAYDIQKEYLYDKSVLVISSYSPTYMIVPEEEDGIYNTLKDAGIGYEIEYMNNKEMGTDPTHEQEFYTTIKKHVDYHNNLGKGYEAIMAGDDDALQFCMKYKDELFPDTPIVFYAVNDIEYATECVKDPMVTGSIEKTYLKETIDLAQEMIPDAEELILIRDNTPTSIGDWRALKYLSRNYPDMKISDINTEEMSTQEFCDQIGQLSDKAIVLASIALKDNKGNVISLLERSNMIGEYANVPVFSCYMHEIGTGCTAGDAMFMRDCGENAAEMVVQILNRDVKPSEIKLKAEGFHRVAIDAAMMDKFGLKLNNIPDNAIILNQEETFWTNYREVLIPLLWIIFSLLAILILMIIDGWYVKKAKNEVEYQNTILDAISHNFVSLWFLNARDHSYRLIRDYGGRAIEIDAINTAVNATNYDDSISSFINKFVHEDDRDRVRQQTSVDNLLREVADNQIYNVNFRLINHEDGILYCLISYAKTIDKNGDVHFAYGFHNVDEEMRTEIQKQKDIETAWRTAHMDNMTGTLNRFSFDEHIDRLDEEGIPDNLAVAVIDINSLKKANDTHGHEAGDELILGLAECLNSVAANDAFAAADIKCYRTGGDEFVVIAEADKETYIKISQAINNEISGWQGDVVDELVVSAGQVERSEFPDLSVRELVKVADKRMYESKSEYYRKKGLDRRKNRSQVTRSELSTILGNLKSMFDTVRIVDPVKKTAIRIDANGEEHPDGMQCFDTWGRQEPCENCITSQTMTDHKKHSKFEEHDGNLYFVSSQYIEIDGQATILEVIQKMENKY